MCPRHIAIHDTSDGDSRIAPAAARHARSVLHQIQVYPVMRRTDDLYKYITEFLYGPKIQV